MERSAELLEVYQRFASGGLRGTLPEHWFSDSEAVSVIGTDPAEWVTDAAQVRQLAVGEAQVTDAAGLQRIPTEPQAWAEGDVGWVIDAPRLRLPSGAETQVRMTAIMHRENGAWRIVHMHTSIGVPNDQVAVFQTSVAP